MAITATCLSCAAGVTKEEYCKLHPETSGCGKIIFLVYFHRYIPQVINLLKKIFRLNSKHYAIIENPESSKGKLPKPYFIKKEGEVCGIRRGICAEGLKCEGVVGDGPGICVRPGSGK